MKRETRAGGASPADAVISPGLEELFESHHRQVFRAAYRVTGNATDAEDVLQTVFLRLARRDEDLDLSRSAASYLHRAAVNAGLDLLRARKRRRAVDLEDADERLVEDERRGPERRHDRTELAGLLRQAMTGLSERSAEIFALRYFEGYDNKEIAAMLDTSQTAVAVVLHRARHRLRKELESVVGGTS